MRYLYILLFLFGLIRINAQHNAPTSWNAEAKKNKRMLPEYGNLKKSPQEIASDEKFIHAIVESGKTKLEGSHEMIRLGFDYLYRGDLKTAMYRFNQAYLLYPKNSGIYWGYGAVYTALGAYDLARDEYNKGLLIDPESAPILTDYGTTYLGEYYAAVRSDQKAASKSLGLAKEKFLAAYAIDPEYINTTYKLSIVYLYSQDCDTAKRYLKETRELGGQPITKEYLTDFNLRCGNCTSVKTGSFQISSARNGLTKIERTKKYQIEENEALGYKLKLKVDWLDECTYTLTPVEDMANPKSGKVPTMVLTCQIVEVNGDNYIQVSSSDADKRLLTSQVDIVQ